MSSSLPATMLLPLKAARFDFAESKSSQKQLSSDYDPIH